MNTLLLTLRNRMTQWRHRASAGFIQNDSDPPSAQSHSYRHKKVGRAEARPTVNKLLPYLELKLESENNLPRGPEVSRRESCALNVAKGPAGRGEDWVSEIGMVEHVVHLGTELEIDPFRNFRVLQEREVGIDK